MLEINYSFWDQLLHRLVLGSPWVGRISLDLELLLAGGDQQKLGGPPIFICGLARAGTTILMRTFYDTGAFRSLTYRDMPFVLMPTIWKRLSQPFHQYEALKERSHGDRIQVNFDSPEAFEEVFWKTFCADKYIFKDHLKSHQVNEEVVDQFREFVRQIVSSKDHPNQLRYLSKNNNNVLRLDAIQQAFPDALIIIPFRDPVQQAISLFQQHRQFSAMPEKNRFAHDYMRWLGHHEFGITHKPFRFGENDSVFATNYTPDNVNYWLTIWKNTYRNLLKRASPGSLFVCFEDLCRSPRDVLLGLFKLAGLSIEECSAGKKIKAPVNREVKNIEAEIKEEALQIYQNLLTRAQESTMQVQEDV
ncbi:MAG: sulfotransferase [Nitrospina sp.]|nr:sulfotransferase [Nitrospina sp.]